MIIKFLKHKWQRILATVLLLFVFLITVVAFFVNRYWSPILADKVRATVLESTDSLYQADFTDANLHIVQGKLVIFNLTLKPDSAVYQRRLKAGLAPNNLYTLKVKRIVLKRIHPLTLYFHKKLDIGQIILSEPHLQITNRLNQKPDTLTKQLNTWQLIKGSLKSVHIGEVMLNDVKLMYKDYTGSKLDIAELKEMNLLGKDLLIDSTTQNDTARYLYFKDIQLELNNFSRPSDNGLYQYKIKQLSYSSLTTQLQAYGVALIPAPDSVFINRKIGTWFAFDTDTLRLSNFDFKTYNKYRLFKTTKALLSRGNLVVFTSPAVTGVKKSNRLLTFPHVAIRKLKHDFTLDTVELQRIHITHKAYGKKSHKPGWVSFNNTNGIVYNITNNANALRKNNITQIHLHSYLMDSGPLQADFTFNLTDSARSYTYKGTVGDMDLDKLNKATMPFGLVKITSGKLHQLSFDIKADRYGSKGNIGFLYYDLKVHILKIDSAANEYRHRGIASLFANALIVKRNNPDYLGGIPRTFEINTVRQPDMAFFKGIWQTLSTGIKSIAGYDEATEKEVKQHIAQHNADRNRRQLKKALRKQRRALRKRNRN